MRSNMVLPLLIVPCLVFSAGAQELTAPNNALSLRDFQRVEATSFFMNPGQYMGKAVEFQRMLCQPVTDNGFSCSSPNGRLVVLAPDLAPASEKKLISERCLASEPLHKQRCKRTIRLVVERVAGEKGADYSQQKLIIRANLLEILPLEFDNSDQP